MSAWGFVPKAPLFGLNPCCMHETDRIVAPDGRDHASPLGAIPLLLFTPDAPKSGVSGAGGDPQPAPAT